MDLPAESNLAEHNNGRLKKKQKRASNGIIDDEA